ncbi:MAG: hypothetical protein V3W34_11290 [Phycisphaerae bacterium]
MILITDSHEVNEIVELVERYLEPHQPKDRKYRLNVIRDAVQQEDDWYYVVVEPDRDGIPSYDVSARLVEAELAIEKDENRKILLVPTTPN